MAILQICQDFTVLFSVKSAVFQVFHIFVAKNAFFQFFSASQVLKVFVATLLLDMRHHSEDIAKT